MATATLKLGGVTLYNAGRSSLDDPSNNSLVPFINISSDKKYSYTWSISKSANSYSIYSYQYVVKSSGSYASESSTYGGIKFDSGSFSYYGHDYVSSSYILADLSGSAILHSDVDAGGYIEITLIDADYNTQKYYGRFKNPYTSCSWDSGATCSLNKTLSTDEVVLSWDKAKPGTSNSITGYEIQKCESVNGLDWGDWTDPPTTITTTATSGSASVSPPTTAGNYYKFRVRILGSAGSSYYSSWLESSNSLRRDHEPLAGFTDDPLTAGVSPVKALHMQELQSRVNTLRIFYGLGAYSFTTITAGATSLAGWTTHVNQVRAAIEDVCSASGKTHENWISFSINCPRADVIQQLRSVILAL